MDFSKPGALRASRIVVGINEVTQLLVDGGYFRAKIQSLPPFDKVAGGLAWGIQNSRFSIDVEFVENAAIRDKIRIAENICNALKSEMNCPHDLEPHQIQGLDYPKIAQVLVWLLKRVAAAREENQHFVREHAKAEFRRRFGSRLGRLGCAQGVLLPPRSRCVALQAPRRVLRADPDKGHQSVSEHASSVLLEYGFKYQLRDSMMMMQHVDSEMLEGDTEMQREHAKAEDDERREMQMLDALLGTMQDHHERAKMSNATLANVFAAADSEKLDKLKATYERRRQELAAQLEAEEAERNALEQQRARLADLAQEQQALAEQQNAAAQEREAAAEAVREQERELEARRLGLEAEAQRVDELERLLRSDEARSAQFDELLAMLDEKELLAKRIKRDKAEGKKRVAEAKDECVELAERLQHLQSEEADMEFRAEIDRCAAALAELNAELARQDQEAMSVLRQIDEYPSRAELHQYETRINELNEEVAWKFQDTRLTFNQYNTRAEVAKCLKNEQSILTTLKALFEDVLAEKGKAAVASRASLLQQVDAVITQLQGSVGQQKLKKEAEHQELNRAREGYEELRQRQERYTEVLKQFKDAMALNEMLQQEIEERGLRIDGGHPEEGENEEAAQSDEGHHGHQDTPERGTATAEAESGQ